MSEETVRYSVYPRVLIFVFKGNKLLLMKYSGKGTHMTKEKEDRKDIYNCIGGHIEQDEDIIQASIKEAKEEAGISLLNPKIKGIINVNGFAGKNIMMFVITASTDDEVLPETLEGKLEWHNRSETKDLNMFPDMHTIMDKLFSLKENEMFVGTTKFEGFELQKIELQVI